MKVSKEEAFALDFLKKSGLDIQFHLISHCKSFSSNGIRLRDTWHSEISVLNNMPPIKLAEAFINGYEIQKDDYNEKNKKN